MTSDLHTYIHAYARTPICTHTGTWTYNSASFLCHPTPKAAPFQTSHLSSQNVYSRFNEKQTLSQKNKIESSREIQPMSATITRRYIVHALTFMFTHTHTLHHPVPSLQINSHKIDPKVLSVLAERACSISSRRKWLVLLPTYKQNKSKSRNLCCGATVQNAPEFPFPTTRGFVL